MSLFLRVRCRSTFEKRAEFPLHNTPCLTLAAVSSLRVWDGAAAEAFRALSRSLRKPQCVLWYSPGSVSEHQWQQRISPAEAAFLGMCGAKSSGTMSSIANFAEQEVIFRWSLAAFAWWITTPPKKKPQHHFTIPVSEHFLGSLSTSWMCSGWKDYPRPIPLWWSVSNCDPVIFCFLLNLKVEISYM